MTENGKIDRLSESDTAYQEALLVEFDRIQGALYHWQRYIAERYKLREGDGVARDGTIARVG